MTEGLHPYRRRVPPRQRPTSEEDAGHLGADPPTTGRSSANWISQTGGEVPIQFVPPAHPGQEFILKQKSRSTFKPLQGQRMSIGQDYSRNHVRSL